MNCPACKRPNAEGLDFCDYCGTPLASSPIGKRKTEMEGAPAAPVKHATQMESPAADPFDPFAPRGPAPAAAAAKAPPLGAAPPPPTGGKRKTEFDGSARGRDPFAPPTPGPAAGAHAAGRRDDRYAGRRVMGFLVTFDRAPDGAFFVLREGRNLLGRDEESDIAITDDETVSSTHAVMICRGGRVIIDDEKSQNGTKLNGDEVMSKTDVADGDVISLGLRTRLLCRLLDPAKLAAIWKPTP
jgi:hypothetical protein